MYLLRLEEADNVSLVRCDDNNVPPYAILSHTWLADDEEVNFQDLKGTVVSLNPGGYRQWRQHVISDSIRAKQGYQKLLFCGEQAAQHYLQYFWVDTCCIDRSSSAELAEAINSMFRWYQLATRCYVYLTDVSHISSGNEWKVAFKRSRWFTRGWTLQELVAPRTVEFFSKERNFLGNKSTLKDEIAERTTIPLAVLEGARLSSFSVE